MSEMAYVPRDDFNKMKNQIGEIEEMLAILLNNELMASIKRGKMDVAEGRVKSQAEIMKKYRVT